MIVGDKHFKPFISEAELAAIVGRLAAEVSADYSGGSLVACPILTGAYLFAADLMRRLTVDCEVSFVRYSSYEGLSSSGKVRCELPFPPSVEGRDVLIVEDVVDSGLTIQTMLADLRALRPRSVKVCTLFYKPDAFKGTYRIDYAGKAIGNEFIVGYGMDYDGRGRNLPSIYVIDE
ncbi:MAG: hypoxanthine phosphoribosyltransferase [Bacteroidales bacterium]|nr:hypoxanthine phosphoribosyltransferase [Bacteroidales bacterium]